MSLSVFCQCLLGVGSMMVFLWLWSVMRKDVSVVDPWWSIGFLIVSLLCVRDQSLTLAKGLLLLLVTCWSLRLWLHLLVRAKGKGEDPRYTELRQKYGPERYWWFSLFQVFGLQGVLILVISTPLHLALRNPQPDPLNAADILGLVLAVTGLSLESLADYQLTQFRRNSDRKKEVLDSGLWRYSRHPNYFGECVLWWGFWCFSLDTPGGPYAVLAPALMTFLLLKVSGVANLESQLKSSKPAYEDYIKRTSAFVPWPPKEG